MSSRSPAHPGADRRRSRSAAALPHLHEHPHLASSCDRRRRLAAVFLVGALILPYIAVVVANAGRERWMPTTLIGQVRPHSARAATGRRRSASNSGQRQSSPPNSASIARSAGRNCRRWRTWDVPAGEAGVVDAMSRLLARERTTEDRRQLRVGCAGAQRSTQVVLGAREQAVAHLTIGREPDPVAVAAERRVTDPMTPTRAGPPSTSHVSTRRCPERRPPRASAGPRSTVDRGFPRQ